MIHSLLLAFSILLLAGCSEPDNDSEWQSSGHEQVVSAGGTADVTITIGDIDPDTPTRRLRILRPLADHIADELGWERSRVRIRIGRSIEEMILMFRNEEADLYLDSGYPASLVAEATGARLIMGSLVNGSDSYHSVIVAAADSPVKSLSDLPGNVIALQEGYSTSGYLLPAALLVERGFDLQYLPSAATYPSEGKVGFFFTGDEENTLAMLRKNIVPAGVLSSMDFDELPDEIKASLVILEETIRVPRKLVVLNDDFDPELEQKLRSVLLAISDEDRRRFVAANSWNWEFAEFDEDISAGVAAMRQMIEDTRDIVIEQRPSQ